MSLENWQKQVAFKIKKTRQQRGLLQKDFAKFGFPVRHYQKIESGQLNLTLKTIFKISEALSTDAGNLLSDGNDEATIYRSIFHESPFGIIVWQLPDFADRLSLRLYDHNRVGARSVYRELENAKGKSMLEIFPKAKEQGLIDIFFEVITTGKSRFVPELIRHDVDFPFTVFSTQFIRCGVDLGAAIFADVTEEYLARQEVVKQREKLAQLSRLPMGENLQIEELKRQVNALLQEVGRPPVY